jgi:hypothetical protein
MFEGANIGKLLVKVAEPADTLRPSAAAKQAVP